MRFQMKSNLLYYLCFIIISCFTLRANAQRSTWTLFSSTQDKTANELKSDPQQKKILGLSFGKKSPRAGGFASAEILEDDDTIDYELDASIHKIKEIRNRIDVGFENIEMTLSSKKKGSRKILKGITGKASSGRMMAIMGPSGSGKTTLMNAIAGRLKEDSKITLSGDRYVNKALLQGDSQIAAAFVEQETNFFPHMTVKETLDLNVQLKMGSKVTKAVCDEIVSDLMDSLSLTKSANTIVGNTKVRGLSGGERKRLSIACEMISSPSVIFLDEPTSGLDSFQADQVVSTLRKLADSGHTIISVIHQPSQKVFSMFDDLLLLSEGNQMYFGEIKKVRDYFANIGYTASKEVGTAEHIIDCISSITGSEEAEKESKQRLDDIAQHAKTYVEKQVFFPPDIGKNTKGSNTMRHLGRGNLKSRPAAGFLKQFGLLLKRSIREVFRSKTAIIIKIVQQTTIGLVYGGIYHLGNDQSSIMDRFGLLSLIAIGTANIAVAGTIRSFPKEKAIVGNEIATNMYSTFPYFISKAIAELPLLGIYSGIFGSIIYPLTGLHKGRFAQFIGLATLHTITNESAGLLIGSVSKNSDVALALLSPVLILSIIFDGKNISSENIPKGIRWIQNIGLVRWGFEGLCINEFDGLDFDTSGPRRGPPVKTGADALARFGILDLDISRIIMNQARVIGVSWLLSMLGLSLTKVKFQSMISKRTSV